MLSLVNHTFSTFFFRFVTVVTEAVISDAEVVRSDADACDDSFVTCAIDTLLILSVSPIVIVSISNTELLFN